MECISTLIRMQKDVYMCPEKINNSNFKCLVMAYLQALSLFLFQRIATYADFFIISIYTVYYIQDFKKKRKFSCKILFYHRTFIMSKKFRHFLVSSLIFIHCMHLKNITRNSMSILFYRHRLNVVP